MMINKTALLIGLACCITWNAANSETQLKITTNKFVLSSSEMSAGNNLPTTYTCDGKRISPPLSWSGAPNGTKSFALLMDHQSPDGMHWYWALYNINADTTQIKSGETLGQIGTNSVNGLNEYAPPCSRGPGEKRYTFTVYALSAPITFADNTAVDRANLLAAIKDIRLGSADMTVKYERSGNASRGDRKRPPRRGGKRPKRPEFIKPDLTVNIDSPPCDVIRRSVSDAGFEKSVSVTCNEEYAYLASSTYPDHEVMTGITGTNEQIPVPAEDYAAPVKLQPKKAKTLTTIDAALGVAVNGVPIYDYSAQGEIDVTSYDAKRDTLVLGQLDICGGHSGRGDDYHYHVSPDCMIDAMKNKGPDAIIGWGYDGYPLYGHKNPDGTEIAAGALDACNGQAEGKFGYRYQTSIKPPYIIQCLVGEVDLKKLPRVPPLSSDNPEIRADLRPPRGGVENLKHIVSDDGTRTMTYSYQGEEYFTTYSPSPKGKSCYDFKQRTISNGGAVESGTFCRKPRK